MEFYFEKKEGRVIAAPPLREQFSGLRDGFYKCEVTRKRDTRTVKQNALLHAWLSQIERESHAGYTAAEWKEILKSARLSIKTVNPLDRRKRIVIVRDTSRLDTVEFNDFLEFVKEAADTEQVGFVKLEYPDEMRFEEWVRSLEE